MWEHQQIEVTKPEQLDHWLERSAKGEAKILSLQHERKGSVLWRLTVLVRETPGTLPGIQSVAGAGMRQGGKA